MSLYLVVNTTQSQMRKIEEKLVMAKIDLPLEKIPVLNFNTHKSLLQKSLVSVQGEAGCGSL